MKHFFIGLMLLGPAVVHSQQPEKVYSIALEIRENSWYEQQLQLWKAETEKNAQNGIAWTNYYMAARALRNLSGDNPELHKKYVQQCSDITSALHRTYPDSFEDYYLNYINGGFAEPNLLLKAVAIKPYDERILDEMVVHCETTFNRKGFETYCKEMFKVNHLPAGLLNWGHNILAETDSNAILVTFGDNDTYATWINQGALQYRSDVAVVNLSLIRKEDYRKELFHKLGLKAFTTDPATVTDSEFSSLLLRHLCSGSRPVYVAASGISLIPEALQKQLYLQGLSYRFSKEPLETDALIVRNYEKRYLLDYLDPAANFSYHYTAAKTTEFNAMYLPSMIRLYHYYKLTENVAEMAFWKTRILQIAEANNQTEEVTKLLP